MVQRQRPDLELFVDFSMPHRGATLPPLVRQAYEASDLVYTQLDEGRRKQLEPNRRPPEPYLETADSLVYRAWPPDCYIESTVLHLNTQTGLGIEYEPGVYPDFRIRHSPGGRYVVMIGHGKRRERHRKEWGYANLVELAQRIQAQGYDVIQVGAAWDQRIPGCARYVLGEKFGTLAHVLCNARAYVGLENGVMVLAGFLGVPQVTIYDGSPGVPRTDFPGQTKIAERLEPAEVFPLVLEAIS